MRISTGGTTHTTYGRKDKYILYRIGQGERAKILVSRKIGALRRFGAMPLLKRGICRLKLRIVFAYFDTQEVWVASKLFI